MAVTKKSKRNSRKKSPPPQTLVLLVRHGRTPTTGDELPGRSPGLDLGEEGRNQAETVARHLTPIADRIDAVYASPLERTRQTAAPIARVARVRVRSNKGLLELDVGDWTGRKLSELRKLPEWRTIQHSPSSFTFPGGESFADMAHRFGSTVRSLADRHRGRIIVVVSHADPIRAFVAECMGVHLDLFQRTVASPCSVSAIAFSDGGTLVLTVNSTGDGVDRLAPS